MSRKKIISLCSLDKGTRRSRLKVKGVGPFQFIFYRQHINVNHHHWTGVKKNDTQDNQAT